MPLISYSKLSPKIIARRVLCFKKDIMLLRVALPQLLSLFSRLSGELRPNLAILRFVHVERRVQIPMWAAPKPTITYLSSRLNVEFKTHVGGS